MSSLESREVTSRKEVSTMVRATCEVLNKVLKDKVMSVSAGCLNRFTGVTSLILSF